jgi:ribA/ribD-fused uncharacterized protein
MFFREQYSFLSNFFPVKIKHEGIEYPSVEHAYVACKTFDLNERLRIKDIANPGEVKREGRKLVIRPDWTYIKIPIMYVLLKKKFFQPHLADSLVEIPIPIQEDNNWHDNFWGVCQCLSCRQNQSGQNNLGKLLTVIHVEIKCQRNKLTTDEIKYLGHAIKPRGIFF